APVWIDDTPGMTLLEMRSKARRLKADSGVGMGVIDYLQLMQGPSHAESRQQEVSQISRGLKALAKELNVPVIALSQLSRAPEQRTGDNKRPQLSDLRESGAIEQDADLIMFLYRQEFYDGPTDKDGNSLEGKAEVIVGKQRNGPTGLVNLFFHKQYTRFESYSQLPEARSLRSLLLGRFAPCCSVASLPVIRRLRRLFNAFHAVITTRLSHGAKRPSYASAASELQGAPATELQRAQRASYRERQRP